MNGLSMNIVNRIHEKYTYPRMARIIKEKTGREYNHHHIGNVGRGSKPLTDGLLYCLWRSFPDFFTPSGSPIDVSDNHKVTR